MTRRTLSGSDRTILPVNGSSRSDTRMNTPALLDGANVGGLQREAVRRGRALDQQRRLGHALHDPRDERMDRLDGDDDIDALGTHGRRRPAPPRTSRAPSYATFLGRVPRKARPSVRRPRVMRHDPVDCGCDIIRRKLVQLPAPRNRHVPGSIHA